MSTPNPAAEAARENARTATGQFGNQQHSAPDSTLYRDTGRADRRAERRERIRAIGAAENTLARRRLSLQWESLAEDVRDLHPDAHSIELGSVNNDWGVDQVYFVEAAYDADGNLIEGSDGMPIDDAKTGISVEGAHLAEAGLVEGGERYPLDESPFIGGAEGEAEASEEAAGVALEEAARDNPRSVA